ncbi:MAG TPA: hypothetical protein VE225_00100 [Rubrobacteraceae bacterium]|jgi:hypothetical protein|nr:hypothetical protein [Rubrobacteraceae bacterium]
MGTDTNYYVRMARCGEACRRGGITCRAEVAPARAATAEARGHDAAGNPGNPVAVGAGVFSIVEKTVTLSYRNKKKGEG